MISKGASCNSVYTRHAYYLTGCKFWQSLQALESVEENRDTRGHDRTRAQTSKRRDPPHHYTIARLDVSPMFLCPLLTSDAVALSLSRVEPHLRYGKLATSNFIFPIPALHERLTVVPLHLSREGNRRLFWQHPFQGGFPMSAKAAEHHDHAAEQHEHAARHHKEAAKHHKAGSHEKAAHHAHTARGHHEQAMHHASEAAKAHTEEHGHK